MLGAALAAGTRQVVSDLLAIFSSVDFQKYLPGLAIRVFLSVDFRRFFAGIAHQKHRRGSRVLPALLALGAKN
jgi:hypothetical protein